MLLRGNNKDFMASSVIAGHQRMVQGSVWRGASLGCWRKIAIALIEKVVMIWYATGGVWAQGCTPT